MTNTEFIENTSRLERYFEKTYSVEQLKIMFEELKNLNAERYKQIITQLIRTSKFMPKIADIIEMNNNLPKMGRKENNDLEDCKLCNNTGYVTYERIVENGDKKSKQTYMAVCSCKRQQRYTGKNYYIPTIEELNLK